MENCNKLDEFCILTKHNFPCESEVKKKLFGNLFDNHESNERIRHCFNATTLGQTFMNNFCLIQGSPQPYINDLLHHPTIPLGCW